VWDRWWGCVLTLLLLLLLLLQVNHREEWLASLRSTFEAMDQDGDGRLRPAEILEALKAKLPEAEVSSGQLRGIGACCDRGGRSVSGVVRCCLWCNLVACLSYCCCWSSPAPLPKVLGEWLLRWCVGKPHTVCCRDTPHGGPPARQPAAVHIVDARAHAGTHAHTTYAYMRMPAYAPLAPMHMHTPLHIAREQFRPAACHHAGLILPSVLWCCSVIAAM
jgi:hypothetical protein